MIGCAEHARRMIRTKLILLYKLPYSSSQGALTLLRKLPSADVSIECERNEQRL